MSTQRKIKKTSATSATSTASETTTASTALTELTSASTPGSPMSGDESEEMLFLPQELKQPPKMSLPSVAWSSNEDALLWRLVLASVKPNWTQVTKDLNAATDGSRSKGSVEKHWMRMSNKVKGEVRVRGSKG